MSSKDIKAACLLRYSKALSVLLGGPGSGRHPEGGDEGSNGSIGEKVLQKEIESNPKLARWGVEKSNINDEGEYVLYHGTNNDAASSIESTGLKVTENAGPKFYTLTTSKKEAEIFAKGQDNGSGIAIVEVRIPVKEITDKIWKGNNTTSGDTQHAIKNELLDKKYIHKTVPQ